MSKHNTKQNIADTMELLKRLSASTAELELELQTQIAQVTQCRDDMQVLLADVRVLARCIHMWDRGEVSRPEGSALILADKYA